MTQEPSSRTFYLALPCYDEGERLANFLPGLCTAILKSNLNVQVQIVDDGSAFFHQGHYRNLMELLGVTFPFLIQPLTLETNLGKGGAVYSGWSENADADFLAFADADGAVGPKEIVRVLTQVAEDPESENTLYAASRVKKTDTDVSRNPLRNIGGLTFRWLRKRLFSFPIEDTQCGFKIVPGTFYKANQTRLTESRYAFDIELLYYAQQAGLTLKEVPVTWSEIKGGHLTPFNSLGLFRDLLKLKGRLDRDS